MNLGVTLHHPPLQCTHRLHVDWDDVHSYHFPPSARPSGLGLVAVLCFVVCVGQVVEILVTVTAFNLLLLLADRKLVVRWARGPTRSAMPLQRVRS